MKGSEYHEVFIEEAREIIQSFNEILLDIEQNGYSRKCMEEGYRVIHTLKSIASACGVEPVKALAHISEDLFDTFRERQSTPDSQVLNTVFEATDLIEDMVNELSQNGKVELDGSAIVEKIRLALEEQSRGEIGSENDAISENLLDLDDLFEKGEKEASNMDIVLFDIVVQFSSKSKLKKGRAFQLLNNLRDIGTVHTYDPKLNDINDATTEMSIKLSSTSTEFEVKRMIEDVSGIESFKLHREQMESVEPGLLKEDQAKAPENDPQVGSEDECRPNNGNGMAKVRTTLGNMETVRVKSLLLDKLMDLVGERMIHDTRIKNIASATGNRDLGKIMKNTDHIMRELQDTVLRMRMVPLKNIFNRYPRMVRDMGLSTGKDINFEIIGNDIEIDRGLIDNIGDALVHLLRNAVDHGLETTGDRKEMGKSQLGSLVLTASQEQSNIVITLADDGRGIDKQKILLKARKMGLLGDEETEKIEGDYAYSILFEPGFSTAMEVTETSGRGVGLDAVKTTIEGMGGTIQIKSNIGQGTQITIKLPPSMSIIRAMLVQINNENYAIPLENVVESIKISRAAIHEVLENGMFRLRDEMLPLLNVHEEFGGSLKNLRGEIPVLVVEKNYFKAGLVVTRFLGQQEIVVKTIGREIQRAGCFSGSTILGDGKVAMIIDVGSFQ